ncbi:hypothetical protein QQZ08_005115 [Neonectria magnoliae]|uniref:N-acetyltransferase domain-containing protein n=1 Tax=Neonectria magnoliae TaxID=2732573 RepID=A0ABR1I624_9HYPO
MNVNTMNVNRSRFADANDVDEVTRVFVEAMQDDPAWPYRFPHRKEHPEQHFECCKDLMRRLISPEYADWCVQVIEVPYGPGWNIVSFAVWDMSYLRKRVFGANCVLKSPLQDNDVECSGREDMDPGHVKAFQDAMKEGAKKYFSQFGIDQIKLQILGTLPEHRRRGFARSLCDWGQKRALRDRASLTLYASPGGTQLYRRLRFSTLGDQTIQAPGEETSLTLKCMVFNPVVPLDF